MIVLWPTMAYREFPTFVQEISNFMKLTSHSSGQYGQDIFTLRRTYIEGQPPPIHMHWRRFAVSSIPLTSLEDFDTWLQERWAEKEKLLAEHAKTGSFPSALNQGKSVKTEVRLGHWSELLKFSGILMFQFLCFGFIIYGGKKVV